MAKTSWVLGIYYVKTRLDIRPLVIYLLPTVLCLIAGPALWWLGSQFAWSTLVSLVIKGGISVTVFVISILLLEREQLRDAWALVKDNLRTKPDAED